MGVLPAFAYSVLVYNKSGQSIARKQIPSIPSITKDFSGPYIQSTQSVLWTHIHLDYSQFCHSSFTFVCPGLGHLACLSNMRSRTSIQLTRERSLGMKYTVAILIMMVVDHVSCEFVNTQQSLCSGHPPDSRGACVGVFRP